MTYIMQIACAQAQANGKLVVSIAQYEHLKLYNRNVDVSLE